MAHSKEVLLLLGLWADALHGSTRLALFLNINCIYTHELFSQKKKRYKYPDLFVGQCFARQYKACSFIIF